MRASEFITESGKIIGPYKLLSIDRGTVSLEGHKPLKLDDAVTDNLRPGYNYAFEVTDGIVTKVILMVVDAVVYTDKSILMIKRQNDPYSGHWALPGGFIDPGETPAEAAIRELQEETGLTVDSVTPVGEFKTPGRDPRMKHTWSYAFKLQVAQPEKVQAGDDASAAKWIAFDKLDQLPLAFDHAKIIHRALGDRLSRETVDEAPLPPDWDPEQLNLRQTFKNRLKYALDRAKKLGGGSSRVALTINYEGRLTVLKVAKNLKGLAQNEAEIEVLKDGYLGRLPIVIPMIDYDKTNARPVWLQTELAKPVNAKRLTQLLHCPEILDFIKLTELILDWGTNTTIPKLKEKFKQFNLSEKDWDICNEYANELAALINDSEVLLNDLINHRNWGEYNSRPVIIDLGYTQSTKRLYGAWTS